MCGIHFGAWKDISCEVCQSVFDGIDESQVGLTSIRNVTSRNNVDNLSNLQRRGPDFNKRVAWNMESYQRIFLEASVLQMRHTLQHQPVKFCPGWMTKNPTIYTEECSGYLCWNGEVYQVTNSMDDLTVNDDVSSYDTSDTILVANLLESMLLKDVDDSINPLVFGQRCTAEVMALLYNAEFSFLILTVDGVLFGRDSWGRRSLLQWSCPRGCGSFKIASVAEFSLSQNDSQQFEPFNMMEWTELTPGRVHAIPFHQNADGHNMLPLDFPSHTPIPTISSTPSISLPQPNITVTTPEGVSARTWRASYELEHHLRQSIMMRLDQSSNQSTGILFSGGVDSVVLAALAAQILCDPSSHAIALPITPPPVLHLYNVSFGPNPEKSADRAAALTSYNILKEQYDNKNKNVEIMFHDIVIEWEDICKVESHIRTLLLPKSTVMDINIATALWFASRGSKDSFKQSLSQQEHSKSTRTPRILLLGMGADELMGGYGRHRKAYKLGGWTKLQEEMKMDQDRLWERNLGRDDRLCSDHGKEARFPFLDANVVKFLKKLPLENICDFELPPGQGDKQILRLVAQRLGMTHASGLVKRAIQFGSRISHLSDTKRFGSRRKAKGETTI